MDYFKFNKSLPSGTGGGGDQVDISGHDVDALLAPDQDDEEFVVKEEEGVGGEGQEDDTFMLAGLNINSIIALFPLHKKIINLPGGQIIDTASL